MAEDDLDDTSATGLFNFAADKLSGDEPWTIGDFAKTGIGLTIISIFVSMADVLDSIVAFITNPLNAGGEAVSDLFDALVSAPTDILTGGRTETNEAFSGAAATTAQEIGNTFTGWLGPLAFPVGVASIMLGLWVVTLYLEERETSDIFPGSFTDIDLPEFVPFIGDPGVPEEGEDQEDRD